MTICLAGARADEQAAYVGPMHPEVWQEGRAPRIDLCQREESGCGYCDRVGVRSELGGNLSPVVTQEGGPF